MKKLVPSLSDRTIVEEGEPFEEGLERRRAESKNVAGKCLSLRLDVPGAILVIPRWQSRNPGV